MEQKINRRSFLKKGLLITAAAGVTVCGGTTFALTYKPELEEPTNMYGESGMNNKILVAYASKAGSTIDIANRVAGKIAGDGNSVDVMPVNKVTDLSAYQAVILGSAIRIGAVLPEVTKFVEVNRDILKEKSFNIFVVCMTLNEDNEENRKTVSDYLEPIRQVALPATEGLFAGVMDLKKLNLIERLMMKSMKTPVGDFRKWNLIDDWTAKAKLN
jgi:menaquinone-dependent protoporphyrinogen oxidase